ncbi:MAG: GEVED domain-containing protein [Parvularculaceae bacterium]|nr:GEVED domain-containing protein [Parvularculaceae bacterium]
MIRRLIATLFLALALAPRAAMAALSCGTGASTLDWDSGAAAWTAGALSNSYTVDGEPVGVAFSGSTGRLINIFSQQTPFKSVNVTGGLIPAQQNLLFVVNYANTSETLTLTITAGTPGQGVGEIEFTVFDVDTDVAAAPFGFQDRITVTGTLGGVSAGNPTFTTSVSNTASGNVATGSNASANDSGNGNLTIKYATPVDQIVIVYQAGPDSIADPLQQGMGLHDISFCPANTDWSDAPSGYGTPSHKIVSGFSLGAGAADAEIAALPTVAATGDDASGADDENGVTIGALTQGAAGTAGATVAGAGGRLQAWFDWNGDGDFADASEQVATDLQDNGVGDTNPAAGAIGLALAVPGGATTSQTYARFRWSTTSGLSATSTAATNGEVEDYAVTIAPPPPPPFCPAGQLLINRTGNAVAVQTGAGVANSARALGALAAAGTTPPDASAAEINDTSDTLVLDLGVTVPENSAIILSAARDGGAQGNTARVSIQFSLDNVAFSAAVTYGAAPSTFNSAVQDVLERNTISVPAGGARYIRLRTADADDIFIDGVEYSQICLSSPTLTATKSVAVYNPGGATPFAIPGNDVVYALTVQNSGAGAVDTDTVLIIDTLPAEVTFFNGDMDGAGPAAGAILFTQSGAGLTFSLATDVRYSNSATRPATFGACAYTPAAGYDPNVLHVCLNPKGAMAAGPGSSFTAQFRAQIK